MVLGELRGMGVGSNARKRGKYQAGQCLMRVGGNWKAVGKKLEIIGELDVTIWVGSNARKREKCQAD